MDAELVGNNFPETESASIENPPPQAESCQLGDEILIL